MAKTRTEPKKTTTLARSGSAAPAVARVATEIRDLIEAARSHVSVTANLALVNLYWNIGQIIAQEIPEEETRAGYGEKLVEHLGSILSQDYGSGFSARNLWDMKRFFGKFQILQTLAAESGASEICQTPSRESVEREILQTASAESCERLLIDFRKHFRLGWSHYRLLLSQRDPLCRKFYFEQAAEQRWPVRELQRQIERGLFERVALSRDTSRLVAQEKRTGPAEIVRYEEIFKDPYVLDFLGLKGAYSEKDLEAAIVRNLEQFLTELGADSC
jgi:predicted nuclease of restriction endonuclease-like (RecB) superfamily